MLMEDSGIMMTRVPTLPGASDFKPSKLIRSDDWIISSSPKEQSPPRDDVHEQQSQQISEDDEDEVDYEERPWNNPLSILIQAARELSPVDEFEMPPELSMNTVFPGTSKCELPKKKAKRKLPHELDNGLVPFPVKTCFQCNQSCRRAPLIQCDFCPLLYHADCLDPPLTALPTRRWMCPAHGEQYIDEKLLTSSRISERVKLWNQFQTRVDESTVKLSFLKKIKDEKVSNPQNDAEKNEETSENTIRVKVPQSIKNMYANPSDILESNCHYVYTPDRKLERFMQQQQLVEQNIEKPTKNEIETWLQGIVHMQSSIAEHIAKSNLRSVNVEKLESVKKNVNSWMEDEKYEWKKVDQNDTSKPDTKKEERNQAQSQAQDSIESKISQLFASSSSLNTNGLGDLISNLDPKLIKALALQRLQQIMQNDNTPNHVKHDNDPQNLINPSLAVQATCSTVGAKTFLKSEIMTRALLCPITTSPVSDESKLDILTSIKMKHRTLSIGLGKNCHVDLSKYGFCNFLSAKHAVIFYDEVTKGYELINYSEHGTWVDGVLYGLDFSAEDSQRNETQEPIESESVQFKIPVEPLRRPNLRGGQAVATAAKIIKKSKKRKGWKKKSRLTKPPKKAARKLVEQRAKPTTKENNIKLVTPKAEETMCADVSPSLDRCNCLTSATTTLCGSGAGWEGSANLTHGSRIKFGCIEFVFAITKYAKVNGDGSNDIDEILENDIEEDMNDEISSMASTVTVDNADNLSGTKKEKDDDMEFKQETTSDENPTPMEVC